MARGYSDPGHITEHLSEDSSISHSSLADPESMKCPICLDVMYLPLALECGHRFCSRCAIAAALGHDGQRGDILLPTISKSIKHCLDFCFLSIKSSAPWAICYCSFCTVAILPISSASWILSSLLRISSSQHAYIVIWNVHIMNLWGRYMMSRAIPKRKEVIDLSSLNRVYKTSVNVVCYSHRGGTIPRATPHRQRSWYIVKGLRDVLCIGFNLIWSGHIFAGDVNTLLQSGPVGRSEAPCPQCRATEHGNTEGVFYNAQRYQLLNNKEVSLGTCIVFLSSKAKLIPHKHHLHYWDILAALDMLRLLWRNAYCLIWEWVGVSIWVVCSPMRNSPWAPFPSELGFKSEYSKDLSMQDPFHELLLLSWQQFLTFDPDVGCLIWMNSSKQGSSPF